MRSAASVGDVLAVGTELIRIEAPGLPDSPPPPRKKTAAAAKAAATESPPRAGFLRGARAG